jgi:hypothetical protein
MPEGYDVFLSRTAVKAAQGIPSAQQEQVRSGFLGDEGESLLISL